MQGMSQAACILMFSCIIPDNLVILRTFLALCHHVQKRYKPVSERGR